MIASPSTATPPPAETTMPGWPRVRGYEVLSLVGAGGMGVVFKARHKTLQRIVALKTLRGSVLDDPQYRERFQAEAEAVARLLHPNIIQVFEVGTALPQIGDFQPSPFISLEFVDGGSLAQHTARPQPPREAAIMVEKLARAAHAAHRVGVIHRDLKPANVLLTRDGEPKIADFGVAKQIHADSDAANRFLTQDGMAVGTPEYMAPEQVAGDNPTPAIDVYALGVILYELLTTRVPFRGSTPAQTMYFVQTQEPVSPRRLQPSVPRDLETICLKCLAKSPGRRYESAESLADDLANWLGGRTIRARPVGAVVRSARWAKRNPTVAALWTAVVLTALVGVAGVVWKWREAAGHAKSATAAANEAQAHYHAERWERYRANIGSAASALRLHNVNAARRALEATPEEYRNWEWRYFTHQLDGSTAIIGGHTTFVHREYLSTDSDRIARFSNGHHWSVWDIAASRPVLDFPYDLEALGIMMSPDGRLYVKVLGDDGARTAVVVEVDTGRVRGLLRGHEKRIKTTQFTLDGSRVATASEDGTVRIWDTADGRLVRTLLDFATAEIAFRPDGRRLAVTGGPARTVTVWDVESGRRVATLPDHDRDPVGVHYSNSGNRLVTTELYPANDMRLWDPETGERIAVLKGHENQVFGVAFSPDDTRIVTSSLDQTVRTWDARTGRPLGVLEGHTEGVRSVTVSPDGTRILSASQDTTLRLWEMSNGKPVAVLHGHADAVIRARYTPDGSGIVSVAHDGSVRVWDPARSERDNRLRGHTSFVYGVAFHPDGLHVASAGWDGTARLWHATSGKEVRRFDHGPKAEITFVAIHPSGRLLATIGRDFTARLWDLDTGAELHRWKIHSDGWRDTRIAFSPDGTLLAAGNGVMSIHLWDVASRAEVALLNGHTDTVRDVVFSPDGRWLASSADYNDKTIRIWDAKTRTCHAVLEGHVDRIIGVAFSPDGRWIASGGWDQTVHVWDTATWTLVAKLKHGTKVYGLAFTPDCTRLACACADNTIRFWDTTTMQEVAELRGHTSYVHSIAFSPDGTRLVSGSGDFTLRLWDTLSPHDRKQ